MSSAGRRQETDTLLNGPAVARAQSTEWERAPRTAARCCTIMLGMVVLLAAAIAATQDVVGAASAPPPPPADAARWRELELVQQNTQLREQLRAANAHVQRMQLQMRQQGHTASLPAADEGHGPEGRQLGKVGGKLGGGKLGGRRGRRHEKLAKRLGSVDRPPPKQGRKGRKAARREQAFAPAAAAAATASAATTLATTLTAPRGPVRGTGPRLHVIPEGGSLAIECNGGTSVTGVSFASFGTPTVYDNDTVATNATCHSERSRQIVESACLGQSHCCLPVSTDNFGRDPCHGKIKTLAVVLHGCDEHVEHTRFKRHCGLRGQWLLCDEDIDFLARLDLPEAPQPLLPTVAIMVDTSWRPKLQRFVVDNVMNITRWPVQLFHGLTNGPQLAGLFADKIGRGELTLTDLGDDYMEDWVRLSSMMLLDTFWRATRGEKVLVFQPDSIMCPHATMRIDDFVQYDFVGPPMGGAWWMTSDHDSQWGVGCGGFSLRDRAKSILMSNTPSCITPAAGKLEDQQLGASWKHIEKRCLQAGIAVRKPSRFEAVRFAVEYDLHMDVLPGDDPAMPDGCTANYYVGPRWSSNGKPKWNPSPKPAKRQCSREHFVPLGCHKCWFWNYKTWKHMTTHCPVVKVMRELRKEYRIGIEFTDWPTRPKPKPQKGPLKPDERWAPVDLLKGTCVGDCSYDKPRPFKKTVRGLYHK